MGKIVLGITAWVVADLMAGGLATAGGHRSKVLVPVGPVYGAAPLIQAPAGYAPVAGYSYAPANGSALAPTMNYAYPTANAPQVLYSPTSYSTQVVNNGYSPSGSAYSPSGAGYTPVGFANSRVTEEGRRDVFEDLKTAYTSIKTENKLRTEQRSELTTKAKDLYVQVIGGDVAVEDLKDPETKEINSMVDVVMRPDPNASTGTTSGYGSGATGTYPAAYVQPYNYYYVYPVAPPVKHHLFHHR